MTIPPLDGAHSAIHLDDVVRQIDHLPTLPEVVMDVLQTVDQEDLDISLLARKVSHDQALTAKAIQVANSPAYGTHQGKVSTIQQAISFLGVKMVRNIVAAAAMSGSFPESHCKGFEFRSYWLHSLGTAVCARTLARHLHLNQDVAFISGLLHDIGRLVLVTCFPQQYEQTLAYRAINDCHLLDAERTMLGIDHTMVGAALATRWHFSDVIRHAIAGHHQPDSMGGGSVASLMNVADAMAHALDLVGIEDDMVPPVSLVAWHGVGLDADAYMLVFRQAELEFEQISRVL